MSSTRANIEIGQSLRLIDNDHQQVVVTRTDLKRLTIELPMFRGTWFRFLLPDRHSMASISRDRGCYEIRYPRHVTLQTPGMASPLPQTMLPPRT